MKFEVKVKDNHTKARRGELHLAHGVVQTPIFMPVGTVGSVKGVSNEELVALGAQIILGNTYHLHLRPTSEFVKQEFGSLHNFTGWKKPILTDSGGYQVFSLGLRAETEATEGEKHPRLVKITEEGAEFASHIDGSRHLFTPERVVTIQRNLGSDIMMALDVCPDGNAGYEAIKKAMDQTHRWAQRGSAYWEKEKSEELRSTHSSAFGEAFADGLPKPSDLGRGISKGSEQAYFGIVQGGPYQDLRQESAQFLSRLPFDGFAIGGVANGGESKEKMHQAVAYAIAYLPETKPRYLMGVGEPVDMIRAVAQGVDMFDCVLPTRLGRHGVAWVVDTKTAFITLALIRPKFKDDKRVIEEGCGCQACAGGYTRAYIHHLIKEKEILGIRLLTMHNLYFVLHLFERMRTALEMGTFADEFGAYF